MGPGEAKVGLDIAKKEKLLFGKFELTGGNSFPTLKAESEAALPAHALAVDFEGAKPVDGITTGTVEPLVGRETRIDNKEHRSFGSYINKARICWQPGSLLPAQASVAIGPYGIWQAER